MTSTIDRPSSRHNQDPYSQRKFLTPKRAVAGLLIGAGVIGGGAAGYNLLASDETKGTSTSQSSPESPDMDYVSADRATPDEFFNDAFFSDEERVQWAYNKLNEASDPNRPGMTILEAAYEDLRKSYGDDGDGEYRGYQYVKDLVAPSENMTGEQILTLQSTLGQLVATADLPETDRVKLLAAIIDNDNPSYSMLKNYVINRDVKHLNGTMAVDISSVNNQPVESPIFRHTVLNNGFDPNGLPTKVMNISSSGNSTEDTSHLQVYYQFIDGKPILVKSVDSTDPTVRASNPQNIPAN